MWSTRPQDNTMLVGPIGRYTTGLFWSRGLGHVPGSVWWRHRGVFRYCNVFHQEVYRGCSSDQNNPNLPQPKTGGLTAMFDQPCQRGHLPLNPETLTIGNKPVTISGDPSKQPNDNTKTKLKNISTTTTTQEACGRASTTSQALKGINQLLWTLPLLYRTSSTLFMLVSRLITPPTQRALTRLLQKRWVHSRFLSRM